MDDTRLSIRGGLQPVLHGAAGAVEPIDNLGGEIAGQLAGFGLFAHASSSRM